MAVVRTFEVPVLRITPAPRWPPFSSGLCNQYHGRKDNKRWIVGGGRGYLPRLRKLNLRRKRPSVRTERSCRMNQMPS